MGTTGKEAESRSRAEAPALPPAGACAVGTGAISVTAAAGPTRATTGGRKTGFRNVGPVADLRGDPVDLFFFRASRDTGTNIALWEFATDHGRTTQAPDTAAGPGPRRGFSRPLYERLEALRELVGLSSTLLDTRTLADASRILEEAAARHRLSLEYTVVAIAGASGSGKSALFNAIAGAPISETGVRRPTTSLPVACTWSAGADGLLDRIGIPSRLRRRPPRPDDFGLHGLVLVDLPDHDSAVTGRREQVDRWLRLADAVVWVVDPEKYADAALHEHYLRPLAGYSGVTFVVLNQVDRLPGNTAYHVLEDLRRLLREDGLVLGDHGKPGAAVLAVSAVTGEGVIGLRHHLYRFCAGGRAVERRLTVRAPERRLTVRAAEHRLTADIEGLAERMRPLFLAEGCGGLAEEVRAAFEERLADAVGAFAAGQAAEREWLRSVELACGAPWTWLRHWWAARHLPLPEQDSPSRPGRETGVRSGQAPARDSGQAPRQVPGSVATATRCSGPSANAPRVTRAVVEQAVRTVADEASAGLPDIWAGAVREAAVRGAAGLPDALAEATAQAADTARRSKPRWWLMASVAQGLLFLLQVIGALWLVWAVVKGPGGGEWSLPVGVMATGVAGAQALTARCRLVARGLARRYGQETQQRLRDVTAVCGRARVLDPVVTELLRYGVARNHYGVVAGGATHATLPGHGARPRTFGGLARPQPDGPGAGGHRRSSPGQSAGRGNELSTTRDLSTGANGFP